MTGCRRAAPWILPLTAARRGPHAIAALPQGQPTHRHQPSIYLSPQPRAVYHQTSHQQRLICQPRCLVPALLPNTGTPSPVVTLDREDGEGRGAKDTAGVHPRRLRRPHLGPRCRSRYVMPLGSLPLISPSLFSRARTHTHTLLLEAQPSPASPAATPSVEALSSNS